MPSQIRKHLGSLLVDWSTATSLIATTAMVAVPGLRTFVHQSARSAVVNEIQLEVRRASHAANQLGYPVTLCPAASGADERCASDGDWSRGWIAFVDMNGDGAMDARETRLMLWHIRNGHPNIRVAATRGSFSFAPFYARGAAPTTGTITVCDREGAGGARSVEVGRGGVPSLSEARAGGCA